MNKIKRIGLLMNWGIFLIIVNLGCVPSYSFTGGTIPPEVKSINILYFPNNSSLGEASLSQKLTDALREKFTNETRLMLVNDGGDLILEGSITGYQTQPVAIQGNDKAALNRLTITVDVTYTNTFDEKRSFDTKFSRYSDYSSTSNLSEVQDQLIEEINTMLVEDIFNKAVINW